MSRERVRLVTFAWGHKHLSDLLDYSLSAVLAPGNLPALAAEFDCSVVILTGEKLFEYAQSHPTVSKLKAICFVKLVALDDLVSEPWQYGMTLAYVLFRGVADLGPTMTETYLLFLNADFILADGSYQRLIHRIRSGEPLHLSPSYCVVEELVRPQLRALRNSCDGVLIVPPRGLAGMIIENSHSTVLSKTVNQSLLEFEYSDQFYWRCDPHTLIGHQMPIALIGMRPERHLDDIGAFWDWGVVYDFCPSKNLTVIGDSDDFLMMELRSRERSMELIRIGRSSRKQVARRMTSYITQYQIDNARFQLTLHSGDLPASVNEAREKLKIHVDQVLSHVRLPPIHAGHSQWKYHLRHFRDRLERKIVRAQAASIGREIEQLETERSRAGLRSMVQSNSRPAAIPGEGDGEQELSKLRGELARMEEAQAGICGFRPPFTRQKVFQALRRVMLTAHPYRMSRRWLLERIAAPFSTPPPRILIGCAAGSPLLHIVDMFPAAHIHLSPASLSAGALGLLPAEAPGMDLCLLEICDSILPDNVLNEILRSLDKNGRIFLYWHDVGATRLKAAQAEMARVVLQGGYHATGYYAGSRASSLAARFFMKIGGLAASRPLGPLGLLQLGGALVVGVPLVILAELTGLFRWRPFSSPPRHCSSAIVEISLSALPA